MNYVSNLCCLSRTGQHDTNEIIYKALLRIILSFRIYTKPFDHLRLRMDNLSKNGNKAGAVGRDQVGTETEIETESTYSNAANCCTVTSIRENVEERRGIMTSRVVEADIDNSCAVETESENDENKADESQMGNTIRPERSQRPSISQTNNHQDQEETSSYSRNRNSKRPLESKGHTNADNSCLHSNLQPVSQPENFTLAYRCPFCNYLHRVPCSNLDRQRRTIVCPSCFRGDLVETREVSVLEPHVEYQGTDMRERNMLHNGNGEEPNNRLVTAVKAKEKEENEETESEKSRFGQVLERPGVSGVDEQRSTRLHNQTTDPHAISCGSLTARNLSQILENCDINADSGVLRVIQEGEYRGNARGSCNTLAACSPLLPGRPILCSLPCRIIVFQRGHEVSLCFRYAVYVIPTETDFDKFFGRILRDERNIHQSCLVCSNPADVLEYLIFTISVLCRNHDFWISYKSGEIISQEYILQQSCQRLIQGALHFVVERDPNSHGWGYSEVILMVKSKESSEIRLNLPTITSYHGKEEAGASSRTIGMTQDNRDTTRICFAHLVCEIHDMNELLQKLYQRDVLDRDDVERIQNRYRNRKDQVMFLLLMIRWRDVLDCFIDVLESMKSNKKAAKILCEVRQKIERGEVVRIEPVPMSDEDKRAVLHCYEQLVQDIQNENQILAECYSRWILDEDKVEEIMRLETRKDRVEAILYIVMRNGCTLSSFIDILRCVGSNTRAIKLLQKNSL